MLACVLEDLCFEKIFTSLNFYLFFVIFVFSLSISQCILFAIYVTDQHEVEHICEAEGKEHFLKAQM